MLTLPLCLGVEFFINGLAKLAIQCNHKPDLTNRLSIWPHPIQTLWPSLPKALFDEVVIFFPDPWPKKRHQKRRLIQEAFLKKLVEHLKTDGLLKIASDDQTYIYHVQKLLRNNPYFQQVDGAFQADPATWPAWPESWPLTRYAKKALMQQKPLGWIQAKKCVTTLAEAEVTP